MHGPHGQNAHNTSLTGGAERTHRVTAAVEEVRLAFFFVLLL